MQPHQYNLAILERHLDTIGHVNNASYLEILEEARWQLATENGYGLETVQQLQQGPVILEINIKFLRELRLRDQIVIHTELVDYKKKIGHLRQQIWSGENKKDLCAEALLTFGLFDMKSRRLIEPTGRWKAAFAVVE